MLWKLLLSTVLAGFFLLSPGSIEAQTPRAKISSDGTFRYATSNGIPNHAIGDFPNVKNPNYASAKNFRFRLDLEPRRMPSATILDGSMFFGIALNGVPFDPYSETLWNDNPLWPYETLSGKTDVTADANNGIATSLQIYVYRGIPKPLVNKSLTHVGYAADGFPIFVSKENRYKSSYQLKKGPREAPGVNPEGPYDGSFATDYEFVRGSGSLDQCNGVTVNDKYYIYILTDTFPYIPRCWSGRPDKSFVKSFATRPVEEKRGAAARAVKVPGTQDRMMRTSE